MVWKILVQQLWKLENFELIRRIYHSIPWNSLNMNSLMIPAWKNGAQETEPEPDSNEVNTSVRARLRAGPFSDTTPAVESDTLNERGAGP